jgi:hypothetical protein
MPRKRGTGDCVNLDPNRLWRSCASVADVEKLSCFTSNELGLPVAPDRRFRFAHLSGSDVTDQSLAKALFGCRAASPPGLNIPNKWAKTGSAAICLLSVERPGGKREFQPRTRLP